MTLSSPSTRMGFGTLYLEIIFALGRGLARMLAYAEASNMNLGTPLVMLQDSSHLDYLRLHSAVEHLTREPPVLHSLLPGYERYIDRVDGASSSRLEQVLQECGYTMTDVERWRGLYPASQPTEAP